MRNTFLKSFSGLLKPSNLLVVCFLLFLSRLIMKVSIQVKNIPEPFLTAMQKANPNNLGNWLAVAKMESGGFRSSLYTKHNNPWGMRPSTVRKNTQSGVVQTSNGAFATYDSIEDAAKDIALYASARKYPTNDLTLYDFISLMASKSYFVGETVAQYYGKVKAWLDR